MSYEEQIDKALEAKSEFTENVKMIFHENF